MSSLPLPTERGRRLAGAIVVLTVALLGASCAEEGEPPDTATLAAGELEGWSALQSYEHGDVLPYDQVAAAPADDGAVWFTRAGDDGADSDDSADGDGLAVWTTSAGQEASEVAVAMPDAVAIPVGVAADATGWSAVAVTRDRPNGGNTGVVAWRSASGSRPEPEALEAPNGGVPASVTVGRAGGVDVVAGIVDGDVTTWVADDDGWSAGTPRLGGDGDGLGAVASARVTGAGSRFVLAAVDRDGRPHLWSSPDGLAWAPIAPASDDAEFDGLAAVGMLAPLGEDGAAVGWLAGDATAEDVAREAEEVVVQRVEGDAATDVGTIAAEPDDGVVRVDVNGAALRGEWLVVVGAAVDEDGRPTPGVWAAPTAGGDFARSSQDDLVDQPDHEFRAIGASGDGSLYGVVTERAHIDVDVWRSGD